MLRQDVFRSATTILSPPPDLVDWRTDTLVDLLQRRAKDQPDLLLYTYLEDGESRERRMTAAALDGAARRIGHALSRLAKPGARVILLFDDGLDTIAGLFGCLSAGLVAVSGIHPAAPRSSERLLGILRDSKATIVLGQARVLAEFQRTLDDVIDDLDLRWVASDMLKGGLSDPWPGVQGVNDGLALIQYTSGSTREPRGVMLTHRNILHNLHGQLRAFGYRSGDTGVSWLPFSHDMGLIGCVLMAPYGGGHCVLLSPSHFVEDPLRWLRAISRYGATLSGGPNFAYDLCARRAATADLAGLDLSGWTIAVSGAEPVRADVIRRFADTFGPAGFRPEAIQPSYGLAEATLLVSCGDRLAPLRTRLLDKAALQRNQAMPLATGAPRADAVEFVGCGRGLPDQRIAIVDPATLVPAGSGEIGEIWVAGPSVSAGYLGRDADNAAYFAGDLGDGRGPYLRTGDLGFILAGELFITGRLRDLLVVRGKNYYPQDLEHSAETSHPAIRPGCSACFLDDAGDLVVVSELLRMHQAEAAPVGAAIREAIIRDHGINPRRVVLAASGSVLKTPSGKIQRAQTRATCAEGRLSCVYESVVEPSAARPLGALAPVDMARVEDWFVDKMRRMGVDLSSFDPAMRLTELGFDSLKIVELKADLERELGIAVPIADLYAFEDIQSLADHLRSEARKPGAEARKPGAEARKPEAASPVPPPGRSRKRLAEQRQHRGARPGSAGGSPSL